MDEPIILKHIHEMLLALEAIPENQFPAKSDTGNSAPDAILIQRRCQDVRINAHGISQNNKLFHERFVLTLPLKGNGLICCNNHTFGIQPGSAVLVYPFQYHHYVVNQNDFFWCVITFVMERAFYPKRLSSCSVLCNDRAWKLLERMLELYIQHDGHNPLVRQYLGCLLGELELNAHSAPEPTISDADMADGLVLFEQINGYINLHLKDCNMTPERLSDRFHVSRTKLYSVFQKYLNASPAEYIRRLRLEQACRLLSSSNDLMGDVSKECGFTSQAVFNRCFKREFNYTPKDFRKQMHHSREDSPVRI